MPSCREGRAENWRVAEGSPSRGRLLCRGHRSARRYGFSMGKRRSMSSCKGVLLPRGGDPCSNLPRS